jgi:hypothetical protein
MDAVARFVSDAQSFFHKSISYKSYSSDATTHMLVRLIASILFCYFQACICFCILQSASIRETYNAMPVLSVRKRIKSNIKKWVKRFLPAEIVGTLAAITSAWVASSLDVHRVGIAFAASIAETVGFYLTIMVTDALLIRKEFKRQHRSMTLSALLFTTLKNMVLDFGIAELADSFLVRPFFMYVFPLWLNDYSAGIVAGKIASDLVFYVPVIVAGEIRTHLARRRERK